MTVLLYMTCVNQFKLFSNRPMVSETSLLMLISTLIKAFKMHSAGVAMTLLLNIIIVIVILKFYVKNTNLATLLS